MKTRFQWLLALLLASLCSLPLAAVQHARFIAGTDYLAVEALDDDLIHFEFSAVGTPPDETALLPASPMIFKTGHHGPSFYVRQDNVVETGSVRIEVAPQTLCATISYKVTQKRLTTICPQDLASDWKGLSLAREQITNVYGLGQQFKTLGSADGDWLQHRTREEQPAGQEQAHGNGFMPFGQAGMVGNVQFPVMYALGNDRLNYALLLDNVYK